MQRVNLLRPRLPSTQLRRLWTYTRVAAGLGGLLLLTGVGYGWLRFETARITRQVEAVQEEVAAQRPNLRRQQSAAAARGDLDARSRALALVPAPAEVLSRLSQELMQALPPGAACRRCRSNGAAAWW